MQKMFEGFATKGKCHLMISGVTNFSNELAEESVREVHRVYDIATKE